MSLTGPVDAPVLVAGAGPVGLCCALALRGRGLPVLLCEREPASRARPGSRAIFVHRSSLALLESVSPGLGRRIAARGLTWQTKRTFWHGREVFSRTYPRPEPGALPPFSSLSQTELERILLAACVEAGVEMRWQAEVERVEAARQGVRVALRGGDACSAAYVVGADGARSAVREGIGVRLEGTRSSHSYVVVDVAVDPADPLPVERAFHYGHPAVGERNVLVVPFTGGWRLDLQCRQRDDPSEFSSRDGARRWVHAVLGGAHAERVTWVTSYRFLQVLAGRFSDERGRVLLVGEAAHLLAPFGARGMNSGFEDAVCAADAIATSLRDGARAPIERFAAIRRRAAERHRAASGRALAHMQGSGLAVKARLRAAALLAAAGARAGAWLDAAPYGPSPSRHWPS